MKHILFLSFFLLANSVAAQSVIKGFITDSKNNRLLDDVEVSIYNLNDDGKISSAFSSQKGNYILLVSKPGQYVIRCLRQAYYEVEVFVDVKTDTEDLNIKMKRLPGYEFEGTVKELMSYSKGILGKDLKNVKVEVYNNTTSKEIIIIEDDPDNNFAVNFERGNHYTILLRKKGYFAKRIEVYVDADGCILCFEGLGSYASPEIESALTNKNERGSIISNIPMKKIIQDENISLENIYYDYDKWNIRKDARPSLENLVNVLRRNPIVIELSSHTDSRGKDDYNMQLSQKRAQSAVDYIISRGIKPSRISATGYGETILKNECSNDVKCSESQHQENRRTEFMVTSFIEDSNFDQKSLKEIIEQEKANGARLKESILIFDNN